MELTDIEKKANLTKQENIRRRVLEQKKLNQEKEKLEKPVEKVVAPKTEKATSSKVKKPVETEQLKTSPRRLVATPVIDNISKPLADSPALELKKLKIKTAEVEKENTILKEIENKLKKELEIERHKSNTIENNIRREIEQERVLTKETIKLLYMNMEKANHVIKETEILYNKKIKEIEKELEKSNNKIIEKENENKELEELNSIMSDDIDRLTERLERE